MGKQCIILITDKLLLFFRVPNGIAVRVLDVDINGTCVAKRHDEPTLVNAAVHFGTNVVDSEGPIELSTLQPFVLCVFVHALRNHNMSSVRINLRLEYKDTLWHVSYAKEALIADAVQRRDPKTRDAVTLTCGPAKSLLSNGKCKVGFDVESHPRSPQDR